jgi:hypothetical protein
MLPNSRHWVRFSSFFGHRFSEQKTKHEGTKGDADTKTRIPISARGARKWVSSLCLGVLVAGLMPAPDRGKILVEKGRQIAPGGCADRFHAISFARSEVGHKAEQFSHEQIWQKPERSLGKRRAAKVS